MAGINAKNKSKYAILINNGFSQGKIVKTAQSVIIMLNKTVITDKCLAMCLGQGAIKQNLTNDVNLLNVFLMFFMINMYQLLVKQ